MYIQIKYLRWSSHKPMEAPKKHAIKMKEEEKKKKTTGHLKVILMRGTLYKALSEKQLDGSERTSGY